MAACPPQLKQPSETILKDPCGSKGDTLEKVAPWSVISGSFAVCISPLNLDTAGNNV